MAQEKDAEERLQSQAADEVVGAILDRDKVIRCDGAAAADTKGQAASGSCGQTEAVHWGTATSVGISTHSS